MLIDWFTVAAQALNFVILAWLMKRVLYKPIMAAIDARETLVAAELAGAAAERDSADKAAEEFKRKNEDFERDRAALMTQAAEQAKAQGGALLDAARVAADALQSKRRVSLQREGEDLSESLRRSAQRAFFELSRRAFKDLADSSLEAQMTTVFCERLRAMNNEDKAKLSTAIQTGMQPVSIRSAFPLAANLQSTLQTAIDAMFQRQIALRFDVAPALVAGIELTAQGQRVGWSIAEYLAALEGGATDALPVQAPAAQATASPPTKLRAFT